MSTGDISKPETAAGQWQPSDPAYPRDVEGRPLPRFRESGVYGKITYSFVFPLIRLALRHRITPDVGPAMIGPEDSAEALHARFERHYAAADRPGRSPGRVLGFAFARMFWRSLLEYSALIVLESGVRLGAPLVLRKLVEWFQGVEVSGGDTRLWPTWKGWMYAGLLGLFGFAYALVHHRLFWVGMHEGLAARQTAIAALQAKVLRLHGAGLADMTAGRVLNLASSDVRRLDEAGTYGLFVFGGPCELFAVMALIAIRMGWAASVAGLACLLLLIPVQGALARRIGRLRAASAAAADERVRLCGEAVTGALAAKMLGWERALESELAVRRRREERILRQSGRIKAVNMGLAYSITPLAALITFTVSRYTEGRLLVADVFYTLALLALPKLYMADFFLRAVECVSELRVTLDRLGAFFALPEPPAPWDDWMARGKPDLQPGEPLVEIQNASFDWEDRSWAGDRADAYARAAGTVTALGEGEEGAGTAAEGAAQPPRRDPAALAGLVVERPADEAAPPVGSTPPTPRRGRGDVGQNSAMESELGPQIRGRTLEDVSLAVQPGELVAVVGEVGAGKSSLLAALLGELQPVCRWEAEEASGSGSSKEGETCSTAPTLVRPLVAVRGTVSYVSQIPWITSGTVRENIVFGSPWDEERYWRVVRACCLTEDLRDLAAGDATEIGERGLNLSGGQKARVALARAAYSRAQLHLLDDPLSAVDSRVGRVLFDDCIGPCGALAGSARLLVTHQAQYLPLVDRVLVVRGGRIAEQGSHSELAARGVPEVAAALAGEDVGDGDYDAEEAEDGGLGEELGEEEAEDGGFGEELGEEDPVPERGSEEDPVLEPELSKSQVVSFAEPTVEGQSADPPSTTPPLAPRSRSLRRLLLAASASSRRLRSRLSLLVAASFRRRSSALSALSRPAAEEPAEEAALPAGALVRAEELAEGGVGLGAYAAWLRAAGRAPMAVVGVALLLGQAIFLFSTYWIAMWSSKSFEVQQEAHWIWGYAIMVAALLAVSLSRAQLYFAAALGAASRLHDAAAARVLRAPLAFFHTNPAGRIINRFSKDQGVLDEQLPAVSFDSLQALMMVLGGFVLLMVVVPIIIPVFLPVLVALWLVFRWYVAASAAVKRHEAVSRSPVFAQLSAVLRGLPSVRAYAARERVRADFLRALSVNGAWYFVYITCARWVGFRLDMIVAALSAVAPLLMMAVHERMSARLVGLALTQTMSLAGLLQWMVRQAADVENCMTSVERLVEYTQLDQEPPALAEGGPAPPKSWPGDQSVVFEGVTAQYRPGLPPVLQDLSFALPPGTRCGVVGRTGSGKSSLLLALFRLIPVTRGRVLLGGTDVARVALDCLRRQLAVIPQDPVLFSGTVRSNLDPWRAHEDAALWQALRAVHLAGAAQALGGLSAPMHEAGDNWSVGQRQLLCLARALLQDASVLALDEATANVDHETDAKVQHALRLALDGRLGRASATQASDPARPGKILLVVAHRVHTIMDCDHLLVLSAGRLVEQGKPTRLARGKGVFARIVKAADGGARKACDAGSGAE